MSRSVKRNPVTGNCKARGSAVADWKRSEVKAERRSAHMALAQGRDVVPFVGDSYGPQDGKFWSRDPEACRK